MTQFETIAQFSFYVVEFLFQCFKRLKKELSKVSAEKE